MKFTFTLQEERNNLSSPLRLTIEQLYLFRSTLFGISSEVNIDNLNLLEWILKDYYLWVWYGFRTEMSINLLYWTFFIRLTSGKPQQQTTHSPRPAQAAAALLNEKQNISTPCSVVYCFHGRRMTKSNKIMIGCFYNHSLVACGMLKLDKGGRCMCY
jgi:hypothetical protein